MRSLPERQHARATGSWLWLLCLVLALGGLAIGLRAGDLHLLNQSSAVLLLAIALICARDLLA